MEVRAILHLYARMSLVSADLHVMRPLILEGKQQKLKRKLFIFSDISKRNIAILKPSTSEGSEWGSEGGHVFVLEVPDYKSATLIYLKIPSPKCTLPKKKNLKIIFKKIRFYFISE